MALVLPNHDTKNMEKWQLIWENIGFIFFKKWQNNRGLFLCNPNLFLPLITATTNHRVSS
jgi:hypothetical protein